MLQWLANRPRLSFGIKYFHKSQGAAFEGCWCEEGV